MPPNNTRDIEGTTAAAFAVIALKKHSTINCFSMADKHGRTSRRILEPYLPACDPNVECFVDFKARVADHRAPQMLIMQLLENSRKIFFCK